MCPGPALPELARVPPLPAANVRPFQEGLWSEDAEPWLDLLLVSSPWRWMDPDTGCSMTPTTSKGRDQSVEMVLGSDPTSASQTWIRPLLSALESVDGNAHPTVLEARLEGTSPASLRAGERQVEMMENHGELLQRKLCRVPKAVGFAVTFFLEPQLDLHNQGRNWNFVKRSRAHF